MQGSASTPQCATTRKGKLTITCSYTAASRDGADSRTSPRIVLNGVVISFNPSDESYLSVDLTFTNDSGSEIGGGRAVYLAIDDSSGENHMRRRLPHVDFTKLEPGKATKFQDVLLAPAFAPGAYIVSLWIPSSDSSLKFDAAHNLLLSSAGVADPATGLNRIAKFTAAAIARRRSGAKLN